MPIFRSKFITTFACLVTLLLLGCANYEWSRPELPFKTLFVEAASNGSFVPQAQAPLSQQIRQAFIRDGRVKIVGNPKTADAILKINLIKYDRDPAIRDNQDSEIARSFDLELTAQIALFDQKNNKYFFKKRTLSAQINSYSYDPVTGADTFALAEYQSVPRITHNLARKIANEVLSVW
jgi:hypothetical protein